MEARELIRRNPGLQSVINERDLEQILTTRLRAEELQASPSRRRLEGWPLVTLILGVLFALFSMLHYVVNVSVQVAERSADRAHDLARVAIENTQPAVESGAPLWAYVLCLFAGTAVILWITKQP